MIGVAVYAAPLPDGGVLLVVPPPTVRDLGAVGRLLAAHPDRLRVDVLAPRAAPAIPAASVLALVRRAACAATFAPAGAAAPQRAALPSLRGAWYAALVIWGWLTLLAAAQSAAEVLGGLWLAAGLPWARRALRRRDDTAWAEPAGWLAAAIAGAGIRTLEHAGLTQIAETIATARPGQGAPGEAAGGPGEGAGAPDALRHAADACAPAGVSDLAPFYAALAAGRQPGGIWTAIAPAPAAMASGHSQPSGLEVNPPAPAPEPVTSALGPRPSDFGPRTSALGQEVRHELL